MIELSIVIPVYLNEDSIPELISQLKVEIDSIGRKTEVIFVIDGSTDNSLSLITEVCKHIRFPTKIISLAGNVGSFNAIRIGLNNSLGKFVCVISADLQEPTSIISAFYESLSEGRSPIVVGNRVQRHESISRKLTSGVYWRVYRKLVDERIPKQGVDVFGCSRQVVDEIIKVSERNTSLVGLLYWFGFPVSQIDYVRKPRKHGKSSWSFAKKLTYLEDSVFSFSTFPIRILNLISISGAFFSLILLCLEVYIWLVHGVSVKGYTAIVTVILMSTSLILMSLSVCAGYLARTYENSKNRPIGIIHEVIDLN
jgi:glycosyltransferase involved in cell wall biosynthesis